ncbi:hypothetical protein NOVOSPHI9U_350050 [Novosphingobium sp. 9U]|nr:hypothetical protein NOVOSPHI9U_350050 [Novosphingobium sp. 9U]
MVLCQGCFDNSPQYDSPSPDTGAIHLISPKQTALHTMNFSLESGWLARDALPLTIKCICFDRARPNDRSRAPITSGKWLGTMERRRLGGSLRFSARLWFC